MAASSASPVVHHLSSVAATVPAPHRAIYAATKAAGLHVFDACRVECEGCGVRFFSESSGDAGFTSGLAPGKIENGFRLKTATSASGGRDERTMQIQHDTTKSWLLQPHQGG